MDTVTLLTTAPMGGYKSYSRGPAFVIDQFLPESEGHLYTTIPLIVDEVAKLAKKRHRIPIAETERRIHVIPQDLVLEWTREGSLAGPWDMSMERLEGSHIQIDEFHHYAPRTQEVERRKKWREWLSEIRHEGATIEFLTQDITSLDDRLSKTIVVRYDLVNMETQRDPLFKIRMYDWYQLRSKALGYWCPCIIQLEKTKVDGRWKPTDEQRKIRPCPAYYNAYNSFSKPHKRVEADTSDTDDIMDTDQALEASQEVTAPKNKNLKPWERMTWKHLLFWFVMRNCGHLGVRLGFVGLFIWLIFFGGSKYAIAKFREFPKAVTAKAQQSLGQKPKTKDPKEQFKPVTKEPNQPMPQVITPDTVLITTDFEKEGHREYRLADVQRAVLDRELLYIEIDQLTDEIERLKKESKKLLLIGKEYVVFEDGRKYRTGDEVLSGGYFGKVIKQINREDGIVTFVDGDNVVLGGMPDEDENSKRSHLTNLGRSLSGQKK